MRILQLIGIWLLFIVCIWLIGGSCYYSTSDGPFNFNFSFIPSLFGLSVLLFSLFLLKRITISNIFKGLNFLFVAIAITVYSFYIAISSKEKTLKIAYAEDAPLLNDISVFISTVSVLLLLIFSVLYFLKRSNK